jgi:trehalose/maltose hydrolase-like predicted phosphorylase
MAYHQWAQVAVASNVVAAGGAPLASLAVAAGEAKTFYFISAVATSLDSLDPKEAAERAATAALQAPGGLRAAHEAAWKARWDQGRVEVRGNLGLAQAVNSSWYYLLSSVRADWPLGMSPGGLASNGYSGHTFWDQEFWMVPSMILMQPDSARSCLQVRRMRAWPTDCPAGFVVHSFRLKISSTALVHLAHDCGQPKQPPVSPICLQYRLDRVAGAASKARSQGYAGLMMPCESALSGYEVQGSAGNGTRSETARGIGGEGDYGLYEQHWNSDIPFAAWQYWQA